MVVFSHYNFSHSAYLSNNIELVQAVLNKEGWKICSSLQRIYSLDGRRQGFV